MKGSPNVKYLDFNPCDLLFYLTSGYSEWHTFYILTWINRWLGESLTFVFPVAALAFCTKGPESWLQSYRWLQFCAADTLQSERTDFISLTQACVLWTDIMSKPPRGRGGGGSKQLINVLIHTKCCQDWKSGSEPVDDGVTKWQRWLGF